VDNFVDKRPLTALQANANAALRQLMKRNAEIKMNEINGLKKYVTSFQKLFL